MAVVALGIKLGIHNIVVNKLHNRKHRVKIVLHIGNLNVGNSSARRERLELSLES